MLSKPVITLCEKPELFMRRAKIEDLEYIREISYKEMNMVVMEAWGGKFNWNSWFKDVSQAIHSNIHKVYIILSKRDPIGYIWMNEEPRILWITAIMLESQWQKHGIGHLIMNYLINECKEVGKKAIELGVQRNNKKALQFYKKLGFETYDYLEYANTELVRLRLEVAEHEEFDGKINEVKEV
ncbi:MAG: GNAT family N-acetyltransferase [Candidatus Hodarchaeales archaeon]